MRSRRFLALAAVAAAAAGLTSGPHVESSLGPTAPVAQLTSQTPAHPPLFAYYYAWFDHSSWDRAKKDYPLIGRYSSDDESVVRKQMQQARWAGIDGFIVSWKSTPVNDRRLRMLMRLASEEHLRLAVIYQGLDFHRNPLPVATVLHDFQLFHDAFATDPVFAKAGSKVVTVWSGTWKFSTADVRRVTGAVRDRLAVLATEKNVAGYERVAGLTDGDAYYWSSVNPETNTNHGGKLQDMAQAVHAHHGYWIAPFAPGFDARDVGGTQVVDRREGRTLRTEYAAAMASAPDALGLISWNEFSENTYVEPSVKYGDASLNILHDLRFATMPTPSSAADSSETASAAPSTGPTSAGSASAGSGTGLAAALLASDGPMIALGIGLLTLLLFVAAATRKALRRPQTPPVDDAVPGRHRYRLGERR
jgi:Glycosyl hydrolase family 99